MRNTSATPETRLPQAKLLATRDLPLATLLNVLLAVLLPGCFLPSVFAQTETATIAGRVSDPSGAVVPGASLHLVNIDKGTETDTKTNASGVYVIPAVQPGRYRMQVEHDGFKIANVVGLTVNVQDNLEENFKLEVGSVSESVTVSAEGNNINTTDGSVSTVIDQAFVANMPLNGRSFQDLIDLTPGVLTQSPQAQSDVGQNGDFSVNGQRTESNSYLIDGISANTTAGYGGGGPVNPSVSGALGASTALGTTQSLISVDGLQEFRVESSTYSAEYGTTPGGQFSIATRSGSTLFHGAVFDYLRNNFFDANDWFNDYNDIPQPALRQNDFGGTLGGPISIPEHHQGQPSSFFFLSYEGLRLVQPQAATLQYVPSDSLRTMGASVLRPMLNAFPLPTGPEIQIACDNVTFACPASEPLGTLVPSGLAPNVLAFSSPSTIDSTSLRLDRQFGPKIHAFLRAAYTPSSSDSQFLAVAVSNIANQQSYTAGLDSQISSRLSDELRIGFSHAVSKFTEGLDGFGGATPVNLAKAQGNSDFAASDSFTLSFNGVGYTSLNTQDTATYSEQWNLEDAATWKAGNHALKFGLNYRRIVSPYVSPTPVVDSEFDSPASVSTGNVDYLTVGVTRAARPLYSQVALFAEDDWRVSKSLNLSGGIRWDVTPPAQSTNDAKPYPLEGNLNAPATLGVGLPGKPLFGTNWLNFGPRLGIAWKASSAPGLETVVRAGFGIFYDTGTAHTGYVFSDGLGVSNYVNSTNATLPVTTAQLALSFTPVPPYGSSIFAIDPHFKQPYTLQWSSAIEQALGKGQSLTVSYVAANGRSLERWQYFLTAPLNPDFAGGLVVIQNGLTSNYQALQVQFQRHVSHSVQAIASYTWSHSLDYGSQDNGLGYVRGNSNFDVRDNFSAAATWDPRLATGNRSAGTLLNGWGLDGRVFARTAFPVTLNGGVNINPVTGTIGYAGLDLLPNTPVYVHSPTLPGGREVSASAFATAPAGALGDAPRNFVRGFGEEQINIAVRREFSLTERLRLQFRAETFNILNHPNFGYVDPTLSDATFGQATASLANSLGTVNALYQQGAARSMQFALKLVF